MRIAIRSAAFLILALAAYPAQAQHVPAVGGVDAIRVPEGFSVELAAGADLTAYPMFMAFDDRGRLFVAESTGKNLKGKEMVAVPECVILLLEDTDGDGVFDKKTVFADTLTLPMGVLWHRGSLYVASPPDFLRFRDADGDGIAEEREVVLSGWNMLNTASLHGPFLGPDGFMYLTHGRHGYSIATKEGAKLEGTAARIWRCKPDGSRLERFAGGGFDNPVELLWTGGGELLGTMTYFTDPRHGKRDALLHYVEGGVYPKPHEVLSEFARTGDLMPVMTKFSRIAPAGLAMYQGGGFGAGYEGNLFSAQFNPHRVQRHVLIRDGATYRTEDSDFLTSSFPRFFPTDVLEDADGSLLVCDTGAWYVDACPLSRVAMPEIQGAIYRVRKQGAPAIDDPWGKELDLEALAPRDLVARLADPRFRVRERAFEAVVQRGKAAIPTLRDAREQIQDEGVRLQAAWALGQIDTGKARKAVREALADPAPAVQSAAAHTVGLSADARALPELMRLVTEGTPPVQVQAATALGRLGDPKAVEALLAAAAHAEDRMLEHAIIFALMRLNAPEALRAGLDAESPLTRKVALVALDQMETKTLAAEDLTPFLASDDERLWRTALWVAAYHPDWSGTVRAFVGERLLRADFDPAAETALREVLLAYSREEAFQAMLAALLGDAAQDAARRAFVLGIVEEAPVQPLPDAWQETLGALLDANDSELRWRAIRAMHSRGIDRFDARLLAIADDSAEAPATRLAALGAALSRHAALPETRLAFLVETLATAQDAALRQAAGGILGQAELTPPQLERLARDLVPRADALSLPAIFDAFSDGTDASAGRALVAALKKAGVQLNAAMSRRLEAALAAYPPPVRDAAEPLHAEARAAEEARTVRLLELEPLLGTGDVGRGRRVFFSERAACFTCHAVGDEGGDLGPDLTTIGTIRTGHDLLEALLFPNASLVPGYESFRIEAGFDTYVGVLAEQSPEAVVVKMGVGTQVRVPRADIESMEPHTLSIMPEGLDAALSREEFIDLLTFLMSLNGGGLLEPVRPEAKK